MKALVLRLASPVQSWGGYRRNVAYVATHPVPTRSGVAGLLGACLGLREYKQLLDRFSLRVRIDASNPTMREMQVAVGPTSTREREAADRAVTVASGSRWGASAWPKGGIIDSTAGSGLYQRHFVPHADFVCEISGDDADVQNWLAAARKPVFMPYLGRQANAPTWPFVLGIHDQEQGDVFSGIPRVTHDLPQRVPVHEVLGDYLTHNTDVTWVSAPVAPTRKEQMTWVSQHLKR